MIKYCFGFVLLLAFLPICVDAQVRAPDSASNQNLVIAPDLVMPGFGMLRRADVRKGIKMTVSQESVWMKNEKIVYGKIQSKADVDKAMTAARTIANSLSKEQKDRTYQLFLQAQGSFALGNDEIAKKVGLTEKQKKKIYDIRLEGFNKFQAEKKREGKNYKPDPMTTKWIMESILKVLTPEQRKKWKAMLGPPFNFNPPLRPFKISY